MAEMMLHWPSGSRTDGCSAERNRNSGRARLARLSIRRVSLAMDLASQGLALDRSTLFYGTTPPEFG